MQNVPIDFWLFIAGLGIFLFGMHHLEEGIKGIAGETFQRFIKRFTNRSWKGILTGTISTAILQSSSMVTLLVLAFLGAGMLSLKNALGVVLGANLGTTFTAWIVAGLGFKIDIASFSFPFLGFGIFTFLFLNTRPILKNIGLFLIGFGLLFLGLDFMKGALDAAADQIDLTYLSKFGLWAFLLLGMLVTVMVQSSSAIIVIILSALHADLIDSYQSFSMVIGANIGTTSTLLLGSLKGTADKKRLALANVVFNGVTGIIIFSFLKQIVDTLQDLVQGMDPLMELVLLNTLLNVTGILLFFPFLSHFQRFLKRRFKKAEPKGATVLIKKSTAEFPDIAIQATRDELMGVYGLFREFIQKGFLLEDQQGTKSIWKRFFHKERKIRGQYQHAKEIDDELTFFQFQIQKQTLTEAQSKKLHETMNALRALIFAMKDIKDILHNIQQISGSKDSLGQNLFKTLREFIHSQLEKTDEMLAAGAATGIGEEELEANELFYEQTIGEFYEAARMIKKPDIPLSTCSNVIRKAVSSMNHLSSFRGDFLKSQADTLDT